MCCNQSGANTTPRIQQIHGPRQVCRTACFGCQLERLVRLLLNASGAEAVLRQPMLDLPALTATATSTRCGHGTNATPVRNHRPLAAFNPQTTIWGNRHDAKQRCHGSRKQHNWLNVDGHLFAWCRGRCRFTLPHQPLGGAKLFLRQTNPILTPCCCLPKLADYDDREKITERCVVAARLTT